MSPPNKAPDKPSAGGSRLRKPVVPVVPLPLLPRRSQAAGNLGSNGGTSFDAIKKPTNTQAWVEPQTKSRAVDNQQPVMRPSIDNSHHLQNGDKSSPVSSNDEEAELPTPSAAPVKLASNLPNHSLPSPASNIAPDTPVALSSATPPDSRASPTPTRPRVRPLLRQDQQDQQEEQEQYQPNGDRGTPPGPSSQPSAPSRLQQRKVVQTHQDKDHLVFGGFRESGTSSPAPHPAGAFYPPGFMPYPPDSMPAYGHGHGHAPGPSVDGYGRLLLASPAVDGFPPPTMNHHHGPPTPHSFQGSQSSMQAADENGFSHHFPLSNGHNGYPLHHMGQLPRPMGAVDPHMSGLMPVVGGSSTDFGGISAMQLQTLNFLRGGIEQPEFSDCTLELNLLGSHLASDPRGNRTPVSAPPPPRLPCHRFILAQSPTLKHLLQTRGTAPDGTLRLELRDQYIRFEAFYFTLRTLYGWDFGDDFLPSYQGFQGVKDEFDFALGYVAAARYLQLPLVHAKAIRYACCRLLHWETIEQACQFALPSAIFGHPVVNHDQPPTASDAFSLAELLDAIMAFVVNRLPPNFVLDTSIGDCGFSRLPLAGPAPQNRPPPAIARGTSGVAKAPHSRHSSNNQAQMSRNRRLSANPRLSQIQFGDLSPQAAANGGDPDGQEAQTASTPPPTPWDTILSRILLNLPFPMLKQVLEHPGLGKPSGDLSIQARHNLIASIVAERETRRQYNLRQADPQIRVFQERLDDAAQPLPVHQMGDFLVNNMGFKEEVFPGDVPYLVQSWVHSGSANLAA